jgi:hypothetical protein
MDEAVQHVNEWLERRNSAVVTPTPEHWLVFSNLLCEGKVRGPLTTDAEIAAYAIEYGAVLYTTDRDFGRFVSLQTINPLGN